MKVVHVITGLDNGGAEGVLFRLVAGDGKNCHQVISLMGLGSYGDRLGGAAVPVHTLDMPRGRFTLHGILKLYRLFRRINPDVIQTWMYHADLVGGIVARLAQKRTVVWGVRASDLYRHVDSFALTGLVKLNAWLSRKVPVRVVFASQASAEVHHKVGYVGPKSVVIPNGYDLELLRPDVGERNRLRAEWQIPFGTTLIGMVARWDPLKDHQNLIAALEYLKSMSNEAWLCALIGPQMTADNTVLAALLHHYDMAKKVKLCGPRREISVVMNALDIHVLSSKSEAFPNVVAEALACGTPCVVTDVGDARRIVGDTGWIVSPSDPRAMAAALLSAIKESRDAARWRARSLACRCRIRENYSLERMVETYDKVWLEALRIGSSLR